MKVLDTDSTSFRFVLVGVLALASTIPLGLVGCVASDRNQNYEEAVSNVATSWGQAQRVSGPVILIPIAHEEEDAFVAVMPDALEVQVASTHEFRHRGIFDVPVFEMEVTGSGHFPAIDLAALGDRFGPLRTNQATVLIAIRDTRGIRNASLRINNRELNLVAIPDGPLGSGVSASDGGAGPDSLTGAFEFNLSLRGTRHSSVVPNADNATISIGSTWPHPSFTGRFLPDDSEVRTDGFAASYNVSGLARGFPSVFRISSSDNNAFFTQESVGFDLFEPVNMYTSVERSLKYGIMFVVLTLVGLLCLELSTGLRFHLVQYGVTIAALALFYLSLLALAEHIGFAASYIVSAALLTAMIVWYAHGSIRDTRFTALVAAMLVALYLLMYLLLRLESYSLLIGTMALLLTLGVLMRATRHLANPVEGTR
ncbi:MAG: cell envelope integrity protein CreD [Gammaproteobacteria bacterium]|nr:cell envelope integrity protein CreD [Gammaproteobacteria bacterium]MYE51343.1 cell envelope integrity protein CreD [Gammaproteobacteria bacterium]MYG11771.1 cell envelope integrity protein CreD [Gammaproteobacteria bacterium]MYK27630.1 cell envelope integrity protein CreD [Gammaproteobacteria bacterium]